MTSYHKIAERWIGRNDPEDGPLSTRTHNYISDISERAIIGFASEAGIRRNKGRLGAKRGPEALRKAFSGLAVPRGFKPIKDLGDIVVDDDDLETGQALLGQHIDEALKRYKRVIVFGGGHETAYGSYLGLWKHFPDKKIGIINLDAHLDLRNIGVSGPSSGTPFNQIRALSPKTFDYLCIGVAIESNTQALLSRALEWGAKVIFDQELLSNIHSADHEITAMAKRCDIIYLTLDIDLMPHYQAPGVSSPAARGVPFTTVEHLVQYVQSACQDNNCQLPLADIVELSPSYDINAMTAKSAAILALALLKE